MLRLKELLFPAIADVAVLSVRVSIETVRVDARCIAYGAVYPVCGVWSSRVHGSYLRFPADVPSGGRSVALQLRVRRFICGNSGCARCSFVEQIPGLTRRHGQQAERLRSTLAAVGLALAGRAGARIARVLGVPVSRSTVLRLVDALPDPEVPAPACKLEKARKAIDEARSDLENALYREQAGTTVYYPHPEDRVGTA
ncbi:transposase family protein [Streptomyces sp. NPDC056638]|uniref:transposase family protein n=1 Tax=Streptomyces sp. NPDC056638 TaxID=3345887 RepID=UPI003685C7DD